MVSQASTVQPEKNVLTHSQLRKVDISIHNDDINLFKERFSIYTKKQKTISNYLSNIKVFLAWDVATYGPRSFSEIPSSDVTSFLSYLDVDRHLSSSSIGGYSSAVRAMFHFVRNEDLSKWETPVPRGISKLPLVPSKEEVLLIYNACETPLQKALVSVLINTGGRISEIANLQYEDINRKDMHIYYEPGKGRIDRHVPITDSFLADLTDLCNYKRSINKHYPKGTDFIFTDNNGKQMTTAQLRKELVSVMKIVGLDGKGYRCHSFRHFFALMMYTCKESPYYMDLAAISALLGHKTLNATLVYLRLAKIFAPIPKETMKSPLDILLDKKEA